MLGSRFPGIDLHAGIVIAGEAPDGVRSRGAAEAKFGALVVSDDLMDSVEPVWYGEPCADLSD